MELSEMIAVMQAAERGEKIQGKPYKHGDWVDIDNPFWDWNNHDYRVAPEVIEFPDLWCVFVDGGLVVAAVSKEIAERVRDTSRNGYHNCVLLRFVRAEDD